MKNRMKWAFVGALAALGLAAAYGETIVTLPAGGDEHFSVQNAATNPLLRVDASSVLSGTNVAIGSMGSNLMLRASDRVVLRSVRNSTWDSLVFGTNTLLLSNASIVMGCSNYMNMASYAAILSGRNNRLSYGPAASGNLTPYSSVIAGGDSNVITGSQNSVISGGINNMITNAGYSATIAGGSRNKALGNGSTVAGGQYNLAAGTNSFAAGLYAAALHDGAFVWADSSSASAFASSNNNEFAIRATGGVRFDSALGTNALPNKKSRYADNNIVAWARIPADGVLGTERFGISSCINHSPGIYLLGIDAQMQSALHLIPVASIEVNSQPTNAAQARLIYVNQTTGTTNFTVYITSGSFTPTNNAFTVIVTGR